MINWRMLCSGVMGALTLTTHTAMANSMGLSQMELSQLMSDPDFSDGIVEIDTHVNHQRPMQGRDDYSLLRSQVNQAAAQQLFRQPTQQVRPYAAANNQRYHGTQYSRYVKRLPPEIQQLLRSSGIHSKGMSAFVIPADSRTPLMAHNENIARTPASVMKLVTTYGALGILGPDYRWKTEVYTNGRIRGGTLNGDLIVKGYGAPDFSSQDLRHILRSLRVRHGIRNLNGRLVMDNSHFKVRNRDSGRFDGKRHSAYNAIPDALMFNERISRFTVRNVRGRPRISTSTPSADVRIVNKIRSVKSRCRGRYRSPKMSVRNGRSGKIVTFSGRYSRRCGKRHFSTVMAEPSAMIYSSIKKMWKQEVGGTIRASFVRGRKPHNARLLHTHTSKPLRDIIREVNKNSNNLMARQLLLTVGAHRFRTAGTERNGEKAIKQWLSSRGLHFPELHIENGSGLSRVAKWSAKHVGELLHHAYNSPYRNVFMQSMSIAGVDGTMKRRLRSTPVHGRGYFKTGTLRNVRSVAGYVRGADGRMYIVSILHNDRKARSRGRKAHDTLIKWAFWKGNSNNLAMR